MNTPDSSEVKYLHSKFPNLINFVDNFEKIEIKKCEKAPKNADEILENLRQNLEPQPFKSNDLKFNFVPFYMDIVPLLRKIFYPIQ